MRLARATRAGASGTATEPEGVRRLVGAAGPDGRTSVTGWPSSQNPPGRSRKTRRRPCRSSSVTASLARSTTAPQKPEPGSSTTRSGSAATSGTAARRPRSPDRTSPYSSFTARLLLVPGCDAHSRVVFAAPHDRPRYPARAAPPRRLGGMSWLRSGLLAAWGSAFLDGRTEDDVPLGWALTAWRDRGATALRLVLPAPGDPRGLPGPSPFSTATMAAGEGVHGGGLGLVPEVTRHGSELGSGAYGVCWRAYPDLAEPPADPLAVAEAEHDLTGALREAASTLAAMDAASWRPEVAGELARLRRVGAPALPPGYPPRAVRLLAQADRLAAVLELAAADAPGGALTAGAASA